MNRPYAAFGALSALLALSMMAVSSSSRSTTVQPPAEGGKRRAPIDAAHMTEAAGQTRADGCAGSEDACADSFDDGFCPLRSYACDPHGTCRELAALSGDYCTSPRPLESAHIEAAENTLRVSSSTDTVCDGRSYYDPVYDFIVYGVVEERKPRPTNERPVREAAGVDDEWLRIFRALVAPQREAAFDGRTSGGECSGGSRWSTWVCAAVVATQRRDAMFTVLRTDNVRRRWADLRNWTARWSTWPVLAYRSLDRLWSRPKAAAVSWIDNSASADRSVRIVSVTYSPAATSGELEGVQSGGWLRHSAASSLYRLGLLLQAAGRELDTPACGSGLTDDTE